MQIWFRRTQRSLFKGTWTDLCTRPFPCLSTVEGEGQGRILQRFPEKDWEDSPFPQGIELVSWHLQTCSSVAQWLQQDT